MLRICRGCSTTKDDGLSKGQKSPRQYECGCGKRITRQPRRRTPDAESNAVFVRDVLVFGDPGAHRVTVDSVAYQQRSYTTEPRPLQQPKKAKVYTPVEVTL